VTVKEILLLIIGSVATSLLKDPIQYIGPGVEEYNEELKDEWRFWHDSVSIKGLDKNKYLQKLEKGVPFNKMSEFWKQWKQTVESDGSFTEGSNIRFFKKNITPIWEDPNNRDGGNWQIILSSHSKQEAIQLGLKLLLIIIQRKLGYQKDICGAVLSVRSGLNFVFTVWNRSSKDKKKIEIVAAKLGKLFHEQHIQYRQHIIAMQFNSYQMKKITEEKKNKEKNAIKLPKDQAEFKKKKRKNNIGGGGTLFPCKQNRFQFPVVLLMYYIGLILISLFVMFAKFY